AVGRTPPEWATAMSLRVAEPGRAGFAWSTAQGRSGQVRSGLRADHESVPCGLLLFHLVEHLHEAGGRLLIQPGGQGGGPEAVAPERAARPGEGRDVASGEGADLEREGKGPAPVGARLVQVPPRLAQAAQDGVAGGGARLVADALGDGQGLAVEGL